jgi:hypothetical protein
VALALLFQPFAKIALGRTVWNVVDFIVAVGLIISLLYKKNKFDLNKIIFCTLLRKLSTTTKLLPLTNNCINLISWKPADTYH